MTTDASLCCAVSTCRSKVHRHCGRWFIVLLNILVNMSDVVFQALYNLFFLFFWKKKTDPDLIQFKEHTEGVSYLGCIILFTHSALPERHGLTLLHT